MVSFWRRLKDNVDLGLLVLACTLALFFVIYPYVPNEGDAFGCWYSYVTDLRESGLARALRNADASGRYPGYALGILLIEVVTRTPFLTALLILRVLNLAVTTTGLIALSEALGATRRQASLIAALFIAHPIFSQILGTNTQDALKVGILAWALWAYLKYRDSSPDKTRRYAVLACFLATLLGWIRSVDMIPYLAFVCADQFLRRKKITLSALSLWLVPLALTFVVHAYGHSVVGHWGVSSLSYSTRSLSMEILSRPEAAWTLILQNTVNRLYLFVEDFVGLKHYLRMMMPDVLLGQYFLTTGTWLWGVLGILTLLAAIGMTARTLIRHSRLTPLAIAIVSTLFFWIFGIGHYEPRYWIAIFAMMLLFLLLSLPKGKGATALVRILVAGLIFISATKVRPFLNYHDMTLARAHRWQSDLGEICQQSDKTVVSISWLMWRWSSYRYFIGQSCPGLKVVHYRDTPPVYVPIDEAEGKRILRLEDAYVLNPNGPLKIE